VLTVLLGAGSLIFVDKLSMMIMVQVGKLWQNYFPKASRSLLLDTRITIKVCPNYQTFFWCRSSRGLLFLLLLLLVTSTPLIYVSNKEDNSNWAFCIFFFFLKHFSINDIVTISPVAYTVQNFSHSPKSLQFSFKLQHVMTHLTPSCFTSLSWGMVSLTWPHISLY